MLQRQGFPFVVVDPREAPPDGIACVVGDARRRSEGGDASTCSRLGHRRIGAIAGAPGWYATEERLIGFRAALAGAGILLDPELVAYSDWRMPRGTEAAEQLLSLPDPPTAIFGFNDNVAIGVLHAAHKRGLTVPDDLSVVGFDDTELATDRHAAAHVGPPAARRARAHRRQPARPSPRAAAGRRAAHGALDEARRARDDGAAAELGRCASRSSRLSSSAALRSGQHSRSAAVRETRTTCTGSSRTGKDMRRTPTRRS